MHNTQLDILSARQAHLEQENAAIRACNAAIMADCEQIKTQFREAQRRLRVQAGLAFCTVLGAIFLSPANRSALAQGYGTTLQQLLARMIVVEGKTQFMSADATAKSTTFTGCNVFIQNGLGATNGNPADPLGTPVVNGLGNLIVGYNELRTPPFPPGADVRTGSHNIIAGDFNNYSSFGGLVVGRFNEISGAYASVSGGVNNVAGSEGSSVSSGQFNFAKGRLSSVSGGVFNTASGIASSVSGGSFITQSNLFGWSAGGTGVFHSP